MHWNHRVVRTVDTFGDEYFKVCEVYYNEANEPCGYCDADVGGETMELVHKELERFAQAIKNPILNEEDINGKYNDDTEEDC